MQGISIEWFEWCKVMRLLSVFSWEKIFRSYLTEHLATEEKKETLVPIDRFMADKWFFDSFVLSAKICECAGKVS